MLLELAGDNAVMRQAVASRQEKECTLQGLDEKESDMVFEAIQDGVDVGEYSYGDDEMIIYGELLEG